jgi:hypothetical protein
MTHNLSRTSICLLYTSWYRRLTRPLLLCYFLLCLPVVAFSQKKLTKKQFIKDSTEIVQRGIIRPQVRLDNRVTLHKGQSLTMNGIDAGVLLNEKLRLTLGFYHLSDHLNAYSTVIDGAEVRRIMKLNYISFNTEYFYLSTRFISLGLPLDFGLGATELSYQNTSSNEVFGRESGLVLLTDFGLSAIFKPIRWIGVKGVAGYRKMLINPVKGFNFDGFFMSIGLNLDLREIIKDISLYRLKKKYKRGNSLENAVNLITD